MCNPLRFWMVLVSLATTASACSGDLTLPGDDSPAALLSPVSGDGQRGTVGTQLDDPLVVRVTDASSQPVEGVAVEFLMANDVPEASVTPQTLTDGDGRAQAEVRLGTETGPIIVLAQVSQAASSELRTTFELEAVAGKDNKGKGGEDDQDEGEDEEDEEE